MRSIGCRELRSVAGDGWMRECAGFRCRCASGCRAVNSSGLQALAFCRSAIRDISFVRPSRRSPFTAATGVVSGGRHCGRCVRARSLVTCDRSTLRPCAGCRLYRQRVWQAGRRSSRDTTAPDNAAAGELLDGARDGRVRRADALYVQREARDDLPGQLGVARVGWRRDGAVQRVEAHVQCGRRGADRCLSASELPCQRRVVRPQAGRPLCSMTRHGAAAHADAGWRAGRRWVHPQQWRCPSSCRRHERSAGRCGACCSEAAEVVPRQTRHARWQHVMSDCLDSAVPLLLLLLLLHAVRRRW